MKNTHRKEFHIVDCWDTLESAQFASYRYHQEFKEKGFDESIFEFTVQLVHHYAE